MRNTKGHRRCVVKTDMAVYRVTKNPDSGLWQMQVQARATFRKRPPTPKSEMTMGTIAAGTGLERGANSQRATVPTGGLQGQGGVCKLLHLKIDIPEGLA